MKERSFWHNYWNNGFIISITFFLFLFMAIYYIGDIFHDMIITANLNHINYIIVFITMGIGSIVSSAIFSFIVMTLIYFVICIIRGLIKIYKVGKK